MVLFFGFDIPELIIFVGFVLWSIASVLGFIFSVTMAFNAWQRAFSRNKKIFWVLVCLIVPFASLVYYFKYIFKKK